MKENSQNEPSQRRLSVLIAEDSAIMRESLIDLLSSLPKFQILKAAKDGNEAIEAVQTSTPDVLILDIHMPRCNGLEVLRAVRKLKNECSIIVLTKMADEVYRKKCRELKADYFFDKLTEFDQFVDLLNTMSV